MISQFFEVDITDPVGQRCIEEVIKRLGGSMVWLITAIATLVGRNDRHRG